MKITQKKLSGISVNAHVKLKSKGLIAVDGSGDTDIEMINSTISSLAADGLEIEDRIMVSKSRFLLITQGDEFTGFTKDQVWKTLEKLFQCDDTLELILSMALNEFGDEVVH